MQHVLRTTTSASSRPDAGSSPSASSTPAMRSESCSFIWHPYVRTRYLRAIGPGYAGAAMRQFVWWPSPLWGPTTPAVAGAVAVAASGAWSDTSMSGGVATCRRSSMLRRMAVRRSPSMTMSAKVGTHTRSMPAAATYPRAMATALIAWLSAPAPTTWTSTAPAWRTAPAIAPATEFGLDLVETFSVSISTSLGTEQHGQRSEIRRLPARLLPRHASDFAELGRRCERAAPPRPGSVVERDGEVVGIGDPVGEVDGGLVALRDADLAEDALG